ncbi:MAG: ABC transporter permease [Roseiflexaceae bacterium]|nr:ABC transporter permease [Roseiflexaceae bacterium]
MQQLIDGARYIFNNPALMLRLTGESLWVALASLGIALLIALPLGVLIARRPALRGPVLGVLSVIYTIPSLAMLVLLLPLTRLGPQTAIVALVLYSQVVLVRNTLLGLTSIDPAVIEAARGMGMSEAQRLLKVELPLALPLIVAGVRIATLSILGIGTIAALINAGGLGTLLFQGVSSGQRAKIVAGSLAVAALALVTNQALRLLELQVSRPLREDG